MARRGLVSLATTRMPPGRPGPTTTSSRATLRRDRQRVGTAAAAAAPARALPAAYAAGARRLRGELQRPDEQGAPLRQFMHSKMREALRQESLADLPEISWAALAESLRSISPLQALCP